MNFNHLILLVLIVSCGVKGDPSAPKNAPLPSVLENYPDISVEQKLNDAKKK